MPYVAYLIRGAGVANGETITNGDLIRGEGLAFEASTDSQLIIVMVNGCSK